MFNFVHDYYRCLCRGVKIHVLMFCTHGLCSLLESGLCRHTSVHDCSEEHWWKLIFNYQWGRQKGQKVWRCNGTQFVSIHLLTLKQISQPIRTAFPGTTSSNKQWWSFFLHSGSALSGNNTTLLFSTAPQAELGQCQLHLYLQKQQQEWIKWKWKELEWKYLKNKSLYCLTVLQRQI